MSWNGTAERLCDAECRGMVDWVQHIRLSEWPQQHTIDSQLRPAMVTDIFWHGFGAVAQPLMKQIEEACDEDRVEFRDPMISCVMPHHNIPPHRDILAHNWHCRIHVPLTFNEGCYFIIGGETHWMLPGSAYRVNISRVHAVYNAGSTPRIHFMFDCYEK